MHHGHLVVLDPSLTACPPDVTLAPLQWPLGGHCAALIGLKGADARTALCEPVRASVGGVLG